MWRNTKPCMCSICHFHHQLRFQRFPGKILASAPGALCSRYTASHCSVCRQMAYPLLPRVNRPMRRADMAPENAAGPFFLHSESRTRPRAPAHPLCHKAQAASTQRLRSPRPCTSESPYYTIAIPLMLHFERHTLVRFVFSRKRLSHHAIQSAPRIARTSPKRWPALCRQRKVNRRRSVPKHVLKHPASCFEGLIPPIPFAVRKRVEEHNRSWRLLSQRLTHDAAGCNRS